MRLVNVPMRIAGLCALLLCPVAGAGMPELLGVLDLLTTNAAAESLELTDSQKAKLAQLADQRELDGIDLAMQASRLPAEQRDARLAPFRAESLRQARVILSASQEQALAKLAAESGNPLYQITASPNQPAEPSASAVEPPVNQPPSSEPSVAQPNSGDAAGAELPTNPPAEADSGLVVDSPVVDGMLRFNFRYQPWADVLDWFADQADLSLVLDAPPSGTFNYRDSREYSVGEALDVLNNVLQTKGYTLLRKGRMLLLVNLEDEIPPNLVTDVPVEQLQDRGEHELIRVLFTIRSMPSGELAEELNELVGPQGKIVVLTKANMIQVTETAGRIRAIQRVIESLDGPTGGEIQELQLQHVMVDEIMPIIRQMLGIATDAYATPSGSLQLAVDPLGGKVFARGDAKEIARVQEVVKLVDVVDATADGAELELPQLEVYSAGAADGALVLKVLQTLLADAPGIRLAADEATGNIVALARPTEHATIRATLAQMQQDARQVEVLPLDRVDPSVAKIAVDRLFNTGTAEEPDPRAPIVQADLNTSSLIVRATPPQIREIRALLNQLGEGSDAAFANTRGGNIRVVPLTGSAARSALSQVQQIWPSMRTNKIRVVTPSSRTGIQEYRPTNDDSPAEAPLDYLQQMDELLRRIDTPREPAEPDPSASQPRQSPFRLVVQRTESTREEPLEIKTPSGATITVAQGPGGLLIASEDTEALDEFEDLLRAASGQSGMSSRQFAVFYLKYADASTAAEILGAIFGSAGSGGLMDGMASAAMDQMGAGMMGDILGLGLGGDSGGFAVGSVDIVPDMRLNALIVYAAQQDLDTVEQLLKVIDQRTGPATVEAGGKPRLIPVYNSSAASIVEVVKQVYSDRLQGSGGGAQPNPRDMMRMMQRGMRGAMGGGGGAASMDQEPSKMSVGVDTRSNSVIVRAPDPLFEEVKALVQQLDEEGVETPQATRIVSLQHSNASAVRDTLKSMLGENAVTSTTAQESLNNNNNRNQRNNNQDAGRAMRDMQRRMEFFRNLQRAGQQGGGRGGRGTRGGDAGGRGRGGRGG